MSDFSINFSEIKFKQTYSNLQPKSDTQSSLSDVSIFSADNNPDNNPRTLTKEEQKAQKKQQKEEAKAERKRIANTPDGIIQGGKQGSTAGDCWLLAEMNSISKTDWGQKALKEAITTDDEGNFTVHFKGINKDIKITKKEFEKAQKNSDYSSGDADVLLFEIAVERHFKETKLNNGTIKGNDLAGEDSLQYLLTGKKGRQTNKAQEMEIVLKAMGENPENNKGISATYIYHDNNPDNAGDMDHAMSIQRVILDENGNIDKVVVLDSYHPDKPQTLSYKTFKNEVKLFGYVTNPEENV